MTKEEILHLGELSRITLTDAEVTKLQAEILVQNYEKQTKQVVD